MEDHLGSMFSYNQESPEELRQKLLTTTFELESLKDEKMKLLNLLKIVSQERDEAKDQLQKLKSMFVPFSRTQFQNPYAEVQPENFLMLPAAKANSSITESSSLSHGSSPVDSFFDRVSSPEFSNMNVVDSNNYLNQPFVQDFNCSVSPASPVLVSSNMATSDPATAVIDYLAKDKVLPQTGKFLEAVMEAGPLLQTLLLAGPLPTWRNPPPLQAIKVPPFTIKDYDTGNSMYSPPMLSFAGNPSGSWNNERQLNSNGSVKSRAPSWIQQRHQ